MMHPCGHHAAQRQKRSHAPIPSRQTRSVCTSTWSLSRVRYVRECCVPSSRVMRVENLITLTLYTAIYFHRANVWDRLNSVFSRMTLLQSGFHVACLAPRRRRGVPRNWLDFFDFESAPRGPRGEGEACDRRVPGRFPVVRGERRRDLPCEAIPKTARRSKKTQLYFVIYLHTHKDSQQSLDHVHSRQQSPVRLFQLPHESQQLQTGIPVPKTNKKQKKQTKNIGAAFG